MKLDFGTKKDLHWWAVLILSLILFAIANMGLSGCNTSRVITTEDSTRIIGADTSKASVKRTLTRIQLRNDDSDKD